MLGGRLVRAPAQRQSPKHGDTFADYYLRGLAAPSLGPVFFQEAYHYTLVLSKSPKH